MLDVKWGEGCYQAERAQAERLAEVLVQVNVDIVDIVDTLIDVVFLCRLPQVSGSTPLQSSPTWRVRWEGRTQSSIYLFI